MLLLELFQNLPDGIQQIPEALPEQTPEALLTAGIGAVLYALIARLVSGRKANPQDVAREARKFFPVALELSRRFLPRRKKGQPAKLAASPLGSREGLQVVKMANSNSASINQIAAAMNLVTMLINAAGDDDPTPEDVALLARQLELTIESLFGHVDLLSPDFYAWVALAIPGLIRKARK